MRIVVGTTSVQIPGNGRMRPLIQNLGPGLIYIDTDGDVDTASGLQLKVGDVYEFPAPGSANAGIFIISDTANTDVRVVGVNS